MPRRGVCWQWKIGASDAGGLTGGAGIAILFHGEDLRGLRGSCLGSGMDSAGESGWDSAELTS